MAKDSPTWLARASVQVADPKKPSRMMRLWGQGTGHSEKEAKQEALSKLREKFQEQFGRDWSKAWGNARGRVHYEADIQRHL